jgi:hypothetical protein
MLRAHIRILSVLALLAGALAAPAAASAAPVSPLCFADPESVQGAKSTDNARAERLDRMIVTMRQQGLSQEKIDNQLSREGVVAVSKGQDGGLIQPLSDGNTVNVWADVYRDTCAANYYVSGGWKFTSMSSLQSDAGSCYNCTVGGYDAFGVALSRSIGLGYHSVYTWGASNSFPSSSSRMWAQATNPYGVAYQGQDRFCRSGNGGCTANDYNFFNGSLFMSISPGCGYLQAFPTYGHTWSSAQLTGVGVGPWSVSLSWAPDYLGWGKAGQSPERWVCS